MFYERFAALCAEKGITPTGASTIIGFSKGTVSYWKKCANAGKDTQPDSDTLYRIADYFGVTVDYLLGRSDEAPTQLELLLAEANFHKQTQVVRDTTPLTLAEDPVFTNKELLLIDAYRRHPDLQELIDRALGLADDED